MPTSIQLQSTSEARRTTAWQRSVRLVLTKLRGGLLCAAGLCVAGLIPVVVAQPAVSQPAAAGQQDRDRDRANTPETQPPAMTLTDPVAPARSGDPSLVQGDAPATAVRGPRIAGRRQALPPPIRAIRTGGLKAEVAALIMSGQSGGTLPIEVLALPLVQGDKARLPLTVEVPWEELLQTHEEDPLRLEIFAYALDSGGGLRGSMMQTFEVDAERLSEQQRSRGGLKFSGEMVLRPGEYSLRILARNPATDDLGIRILSLQVLAEGTTVSPMLISSSTSGWESIRQAYERGKAPEPIASLGQTPEAKPVLASQESTAFTILATNLAAVPSQVTIQTLDYDDLVVGEIPAEIDAYGEASANGTRALTAHFETLLGPGNHRLRAHLKGDMGEEITTPVLPVMVVASSTGDPITWAKVDPSQLTTGFNTVQEPRGSDRQDARTPARRRKKIETGGMVTSYTAVLQSLADGEGDAAARSLYELEKAQKNQGFEVLEVLRAVQVDLASRVARISPKALAPILWLHHGQYQRMRARRDPLLSTHSRTVSIQLIELYLGRTQDPAAKELIIALMTSLGSEAQQAGMVRLSENLLKRSLELDPSNAVSLLNLGVGAERRGDYRLAIGYLDELVTAYPDHGQGRVRLAVNLIREKKRKAARRHLETVVEGQHRKWILSLAYQELARLYVRDDAFELAAQLLQKGIERLPSDQKLYLQLAFVLDANQQPDKVEQTLQDLDLRARSNHQSSRHRYTQWPREALEIPHNLIDRRAKDQTPELAKVVRSSAFRSSEDS